MRRFLKAAFLSAAVLTAFTLPAAAAPTVKLWRLDCGQIQANALDLFSDTRAYVGQSKLLTDSCYLIQHGERYLLWDTGLAASELGVKLNGKDPLSDSLSVTIVSQLKTLGLSADKISDIAISHYHFDHTGQAADFPGARLLIGKADAEALRDPDNPRAKPLAHWLTGGGKLEAVSGDYDVFGDGTVVMLDLPGHTPGHHGLLVKLAKTGAVLLSGDVVHFHENQDTNGVPSFNTNRADSLASMDRTKALAANLKAITVIQHDPRDVGKLPAFPQAAE